MIDSRPSARTTFVASLLLWIPWLLSALPIFVLFLEFRCGELGECGAEWWYYARFNSNLFLYSVTFGLISTALLHRPWVRTVHHLHSLPGSARFKTIGVVVLGVVGAAGLFSHGEFYYKHSTEDFKECTEDFSQFGGAAPAPWFIAPDVMEDEDKDMRIRSLFTKRCGKVSPPLTIQEKCEFQSKLSILWEDRDGSASYTARFYRAGTVAMTIGFALLFATLYIMGTSKSMKNAAGRRSSEDKQMKTLLVLAYQFAMFWALMRVGVIRENQSLYAEDPLLTFNYLILFLFAFGFAVISICWPEASRYERYRARFFGFGMAGLFLSIAGFATQIIGLEGTWIPDQLVRVFGTGGSLGSYLSVLFLLFVAHFRYILRWARDDKSDDPGGPGAT